MATMLQKMREWLVLVLIALLPFHALAVTVKTKIILGPDHAPMGMLALWKEAVLGIILVLAAIEILSSIKKQKLPDLIDRIIIALIILSVLVTAATHANWSLYLFGFKYDFIPLVTFFVLRRVDWSEWFKKTVINVILIDGVIVSLYGIITLFMPAEFFRALGYSDLHSLYLPDKPLAPFQQIGGSVLRRMQSSMSGPNQLGIWLLIPLGILLRELLASSFKLLERKKLGLMLMLFGVALLLTFSRAAWIGAMVMLIVALYPWLKRLSSKILISGAAGIVLLGVIAAVLFPSVLLRVSSSTGHIERPIEAINMMANNPLGRGLGTAGPASNRVSDACVMLDAGADASWAKDRPDLCVFVGDVQVQPPLPTGELRPAGQPIGRACNCPFLPENWYLQIGVELGWVGFAIYIALIVFVLYRLKERALKLSFIGISVAALFLHAWEDAAVAYTLWLLLGSSYRR
jgi:hypothetical protein